VARDDSSHDCAPVNVGSDTHLATLRLMRVAVVGDYRAALDHAIAVLEALNALDHDHVVGEFVQIECPGNVWVIERSGEYAIESATIVGAVLAYLRSRS